MNFTLRILNINKTNIKGKKEKIKFLFEIKNYDTK
jgi:hypothetical protein